MILNWKGAADDAAPNDVSNGAAKPDSTVLPENGSSVQCSQLVLSDVMESRWPAPGTVAVWHELKPEEIAEVKELDASSGSTPPNVTFHCRHCFCELVMYLKEGQEPTARVFSCIEHKADGVDDKGRAVSWSKPGGMRFCVPCHAIG